MIDDKGWGTPEQVRHLAAFHRRYANPGLTFAESVRDGIAAGAEAVKDLPPLDDITDPLIDEALADDPAQEG